MGTFKEKTESEIITFYEENKNEDLGGAMAGDLLGCLSFDAAKPYLKGGATKEDWVQEKRDRVSVVSRMCGYMSFALLKAREHRGISAERSIEHYKAWLFLLGDDYTLAYLQDPDNYSPYGVPLLKAICDKYEFKFPNENARMMLMAKGRPCADDCDGCGTFYVPSIMEREFLRKTK